MNRTTIVKSIAAAGLATAALAGCSSSADVASQNLSAAADNFEIARRIVFINGITDKNLLVIEGRCNIAAQGDGRGQLEVTCRTPQGDKKHFLGLSDNVTYFVEQMNPQAINGEHYRVFFNPSVIIPDIDAK